MGKAPSGAFFVRARSGDELRCPHFATLRGRNRPANVANCVHRPTGTALQKGVSTTRACGLLKTVQLDASVLPKSSQSNLKNRR